MLHYLHEAAIACVAACAVLLLFLPGKGCFLNALVVSIGQASDGKWCTSSKQLQLASFDVCGACQSGRTQRHIVGRGMPFTL